MRRLILLLIAAAGLLLAWSLGSGAQPIDADPCRQACFEEKAACVTACGTHDNPMECESDCREQHEECTERC